MAPTWPIIPKYTFPLEDGNDYKGRITFSAYKEQYGTLGAILGNASGVDKRKVVEGGQGISDTFTGTIKEGWNAYFAKGKDLQTVKSSAPTPQSRGAASLYLPPLLQFADGVSYGDADLGIAGAGAANLFQNPNTTLGSAGGYGAAALSDFFSSESLADAVLTGMGSEVAQIGALRIARRVNTEVQGAIETTTGIAINPNRRSTFKGVGLRKFQFNFRLIPTSQAEAEAIKSIIKWFRTEMYPETVGQIGNSDNLSVAYRFPSKFKISMMYGNKRVATGILPCFLENVNTTYNPNSMAFHKDGAPQQTDITLSFVEERTLNRKDVAEGNY
tara:strand:- start:524 stop:1513 length:990 start_codon:yes stop_codon:yes gene_type:complete